MDTNNHLDLTMSVDEIIKSLAGGQTVLGDAAGKDGVCIWWNIGAATQPDPLRELSEKWYAGRKLFQPKLRSWNDCLTKALRNGIRGYASGAYMISATKLDTDELASVEVRRIIKDVRENDYPRVCRAYIKEDSSNPNGIRTWITDYDHHGVGAPVECHSTNITVAELRKALPPESVGEWIVGMIMESRIGAVRMNAGGKNYFIPESSVEDIQELRQVVRHAADDRLVRGCKNRLTIAEMRMTPDILEDALDGLNDKMDYAVARIREVADSGVGIRSLRARQKEAEGLLSQLEKYQNIASKADIDKIKAQIAEVQTAVGLEIARKQGELEKADSGHDAMLDAMLGM